MRIGDVGLPLAAMGEPRKDENLANEIGKAPGQLGGLPPLEAQNQADVAALRQGATDALRPEGGDVDSHALRKKTLCMNAWAPARHREQSCRPYPGKTPCPKEVLCHYAAIDVALANDKHSTGLGRHPCCSHCACCTAKGQREAPPDPFPQCSHTAIELANRRQRVRGLLDVKALLANQDAPEGRDPGRDHAGAGAFYCCRGEPSHVPAKIAHVGGLDRQRNADAALPFKAAQNEIGKIDPREKRKRNSPTWPTSQVHEIQPAALFLAMDCHEAGP